MVPHTAIDAHFHAQMCTLAIVVSGLLANTHTPKPFKRLLVKFIRSVREFLPQESKTEIRAAEAKAVIYACAELANDRIRPCRKKR